MALPWFRMYAEFATDPVVQSLSFDDQRHFVMVLCLKCSGVLDREYETRQARIVMLRRALGLDALAFDEAKRRLQAARLIGADWQPANWNKRQFLSDQDPTAAERKRRQRARHVGVTRDTNKSHVSVTDESRPPDTDTDTEQKKVPSEPMSCSANAVETVFEHWRQVHRHPKASLDAKRRKVIRDALKSYSEADLCQAISGYLNSPHHMGQNATATVYGDIELFLRDAKHIDAGLKFHAEPPRTDLSEITRRNVAATETWQPPELRNANR